MTLIFLLPLLLATSSYSQDCGVFQEGACPLSEDNILGSSDGVDNPADCQALCISEPSGNCNFFTSINGQCYLQQSCDSVQDCVGCVCGPTEPDFGDCQGSPTYPPTTYPPTTYPPTSTIAPTEAPTWPPTTAPATTLPPATTTTPTPTRPSCDINFGMICEDHGEIEHIEHIHTASDCQAICQNHPECQTWSHWLQAEGHDHWGHCLIHRSCEHFTDHECFELGSHECNEIGPGPRPGGRKCDCQSGAPTPDLEECGDPAPTPLPCLDQFWPGLRCDEHENEIAHIEHISSRSDCQAICQNHAGCEFFSHFMDEHGDRGDCFLHWNCDHLTDHECEDCFMRPHHCSCFAGPKYPDMDDCSEEPTVAP